MYKGLTIIREKFALNIRPFTTEDLLDIHAYASDEDTTKYMLWGPNTLEDAQDMIEFEKKLGINQVFTTFDSRNIASIQLMVKLGLHYVRTDYQNRFNKVTQQKDLDQVYYEMNI